MIIKSLKRLKRNVLQVTTVSFSGFERCHMILTMSFKVPPIIGVFMNTETPIQGEENY